MLLNTPPKGTSDRFPKEFSVRKYIFDTWRTVCKKFGYEEYLGPLVENADIWRAKSGEDVGGSELTLITDRTGKISDLALRPEMTPTVTRMVSRIYLQEPKPIRYFSIANFYRNERPQRGRNREFRQLNIDLFGSHSVYADLEILQVAMEIMLAFNPPKSSRCMYLNSRQIIDYVLDEEVKVPVNKKTEIVRLMDKREKLKKEDFILMLQDHGLNPDQIDKIVSYLSIENISALAKKFPAIEKNEGYMNFHIISSQLAALGYGHLFQFKGSLIRGFDYYDGVVFEVFDLHPDNRRAMFGGGRYNGLAEIFGAKTFPAVGCAPGDEAMKLFLESRAMIPVILDAQKPELYYVPMLEEEYYDVYCKLAQKLRDTGKMVEQSLELQGVAKALQYANKKEITFVILLGKEEMQSKKYKIKNMKTGEENQILI
ncbi:MAG: histidine--tRNA ligase [candidate division SR1 bacterium]|nr:histidine--tRNA ligase [candidate division SR1 bacterium]